MKRFSIISLSVLILVISLCAEEPDSVFRSEPTNLSKNQIKEMILKYDFYDDELNPQGKGFNNDFELIKDGKVVYDRASRLMWQQDGSDYTMMSGMAEGYIYNLNKSRFAGYDDWRLPTLEEAMSLMEPVKENDLYINPIFDSIKNEYIWTSDWPNEDKSLRCYVSFYNGTYDVSELTFFLLLNVCAVRSSQSSGE